MTKYILHGGETGVPNEHNKAFYQEWVKDFDSDFRPTILLVYFSRLDEDYDRLEGSDRERFIKFTDNRPVKFIVAEKDPKVFREQIKECDVMYVRGGNPEKLIKAFLPLKDVLVELLQDKVYAGSSAGVMAISQYARSHGTDWKRGLGLIPVNAIVHWSDDLQESLDGFKEDHLDSKDEYLLIAETEFIVKTY
ncbi:MAG: Type 1 glutamine amidotransferase-like domain-containing protein [Candidatus Komeilibacteria bacterium]